MPRKTTRNPVKGQRARAKLPTKPISGPVAPEPTDVANSPEHLAERLGVSMLGLKVLCAMGMPGPYDYGPFVSTAAEVAKHFGVSPWTVAAWKPQGMPWREGHYSIPRIGAWRHHRFGDEPPKVDALTALLRVVRSDVVCALRQGIDEAVISVSALDSNAIDYQVQVEACMMGALAPRFRQLLTSEDELAELVGDGQLAMTAVERSVNYSC